MEKESHFNTIFIADETKFHINNNEHETAVYYIAIEVPKGKANIVQFQYDEIIKKHKLSSKGFHASKILKEKSPNKSLIIDLSHLIVSNNIRCFWFKYSFIENFEKIKKAYSKFSTNDIDFTNFEHQGLYSFVATLQNFLSEDKSFVPKGILFCDRNFYGVSKTEERFFSENHPITSMTHTSKSKIKLIGLPDFICYIIRKTQILELESPPQEPSELLFYSTVAISQIIKKGLFIKLFIRDGIYEK